MDSAYKEQIEKEEAYIKYIGYFKDEKGLRIKDFVNFYETLYDILTKDLEQTKQILGGYYFEKFIVLLNDSLDIIEADIKEVADIMYCDNEIQYGYYFHFKPKLEKVISQLIQEQPEKVKTEKVKKEFKDFFNSDVQIETIERIQNEFKDYTGKKMAMLIYLLDKEFNLISYSLNSETEGRKCFVESLNTAKLTMYAINKFFITHTHTLDITNFKKNNDYVTIKEKLVKAIK